MVLSVEYFNIIGFRLLGNQSCYTNTVEPFMLKVAARHFKKDRYEMTISSSE